MSRHDLAEIWCARCPDGRRPIARLVLDARDHQVLVRYNLGAALEHSIPRMTDLSTRRGQLERRVALACAKHGATELDVAALRDAVRTRPSATRPAKISA